MWMKTEQGTEWEWDQKYTSPNEAMQQAQILTEQCDILVLSRQIEGEPLYECYTHHKLEVPRPEHSNLCRCKECYTPPQH